MSTESNEYKTIQKSFEKLVIIFQNDPMSVACKLFSDGFISSGQFRTMGSLPKDAQAREIVLGVMNQIQLTPIRYQEFVGLLHQEPWLKNITEILCTTYEKLSAESGVDERVHIVPVDDNSPRHQQLQAALEDVPNEAESLSPYSDATVQSLIEEFEEKFLDLQCQALNELQEKKLEVKCVQQRILLLPESIKREHYHYLKTNIEALNRIASLDELFMYLNLYWSFFDYNLLEHIVKKHGSKELKESMKRYSADMGTFRQRTTVSQLMAFWPCQFDPPPHFSTLEVKLDIDPDKCTLEHLEKFRKELCRESRLSEFALKLYKSKSGSVIIIWIVPSEVVPTITCSRYNKEFFARHHILYMSIDGEGVDEMALLPTSCEYGDVELVNSLLQGGMDPNSEDPYGNTALMWASHYGYLQIAQLLLNYNADVNARRQNGYSALMRASRAGHTEITRLLLNHHADIEARTKDGSTPLKMASECGHVNTVILLLSHNADVNAREESGYTPLISASEEGFTEIVRLLLSHQANVNIKTEGGWTALIQACQYGHTDIVRLLLSHQADVNVIQKTGSTALIMACQNGHTEIVEILLKCNADVNARRMTGSTALSLASQEGYLDIVKILLVHHANVNTTYKGGGTPLMFASLFNHPHIVKELLNHQADVNAVDEDGLTALAMATKKGHSDVVMTLLGAKADTNIAEKVSSWTPLFFAAKDGCTDIAELLIEHGAEVDCADKFESTAYDIARVYNHPEVSELLEKYSQLKEQRKLNEESRKQVLNTGNYIQRLFNVLESRLLPERARKREALATRSGAVRNQEPATAPV